MIKSADYLIDLNPEGGSGGGRYLRQVLDKSPKEPRPPSPPPGRGRASTEANPRA